MNSYHELEGMLKNKKKKNKEHEAEKSKKKSQMVCLSCESSASSFDTPPTEPKFDVDLSEDEKLPEPKKKNSHRSLYMAELNQSTNHRPEMKSEEFTDIFLAGYFSLN
ncbi:hypothetical protein HNY73_002581 [Argiope bruennichi]|uniref:Uncharacterized protein n=1 Tax=Argiope bruennichi TaxID=94029 RepID=A0A8T0G0C7_ARGBR|nr:hypothetical protein HNY73_002581 [Argiope bruennichi]